MHTLTTSHSDARLRLTLLGFGLGLAATQLAPSIAHAQHSSMYLQDLEAYTRAQRERLYRNFEQRQDNHHLEDACILVGGCIQEEPAAAPLTSHSYQRIYTFQDDSDSRYLNSGYTLPEYMPYTDFGTAYPTVRPSRLNPSSPYSGTQYDWNDF